MASLSHPNLAVVYSVETWEDVPFIVEEYLAGGTLSTRLTLGRIRASRDALDLGIVLAGAVGALHAARIIHCDIKPSNIGFTAAGVVKLLDFGLARLLREAAAVDDGTTHTRVRLRRRSGPRCPNRHCRDAALHGARSVPRRDAASRRSISGG